MKIILTGADGMLGTDLKEALCSMFHVSCYAKNDLDITNPAQIEEKISEVRPDILINAAAYTAVDKAESEFELAKKINGTAVGFLAKACRTHGVRLIHFSTDYVFDGGNPGGYSEDAKPNPINAYGKSKLLGEELIEKSGCDFAIIRTSWLYGKNGKNFVDTMLRLGKERQELKVVADQTGSPTYSLDLAKAILQLLENPSFCHPRENGDPEKKSGEIFHLTNSDTTTWADFAREIFRLAKLPTKVISISTNEYPLPAKRPSCSILLNTKLPKLRSWQEALREYLQQ